MCPMKKEMPTASFMGRGITDDLRFGEASPLGDLRLPQVSRPPLGRNRVAVIVPIELWEELTSENDTDATEELLSISGFERGSPRYACGIRDRRRRAQGQHMRA